MDFPIQSFHARSYDPPAGSAKISDSNQIPCGYPHLASSGSAYRAPVRTFGAQGMSVESSAPAAKQQAQNGLPPRYPHSQPAVRLPANVHYPAVQPYRPNHRPAAVVGSSDSPHSPSVICVDSPGPAPHESSGSGSSNSSDSAFSDSNCSDGSDPGSSVECLGESSGASAGLDCAS